MFVKTSIMKAASIATLICLLIFLPAQAQKTVTSKEKMKLVMPDGKGTNGVGVAWNPGKKIYYACFAGNESYPMVMFSKKGKVIKSSLTTQYDVRGFWFNKAENRLEGTVYGGSKDESGYFFRTLAKDGSPDDQRYVKFPNMYIPDDQTVGAYDYNKNELLFRDRETVIRYSKADGAEKGKVELTLPEGAKWGNISEYTTIYTGKSGEEYGIFDYEKSKVYLFDATTGKCAKIVVMPEEAPDPESFNFSYTNGMFWLFSVTSRTWRGYTHP